jgi:glycosyltransferase involved in cell wall biosynthesis
MVGLAIDPSGCFSTKAMAPTAGAGGVSTRTDILERSSKPQILFVTHSAQISGAELILYDLVRDGFATSQILLFEDGPLKGYLEAAGLQVTTGDRLDGVARVRRDGTLRIDIPFFRSMSRAIAQIARMARQHHLIYASSQKAFVAAAFAASLARRPLIWHLHDIMTREHFGTKQIRIAISLANRVAARVIVPSRAAAEAFSDAGGLSKKLRVVPNGVSVPAGTRSLDRNRLRVELDLPKGFLICVVGRLAPWKGQQVMLEALASLPDAQCIIVGDALFGESAYAEELRRLVTVLGLGNRVRFLGHRSDVPHLIRASDIVVHTSVMPEPFGRVIVEAMLCGTPVAATRSGGVPEILGECLDALLYPPGDAVTLANLLASFREGRSCETQLINKGMERAQRLFSVERMRRNINCVVLEALAGQR